MKIVDGRPIIQPQDDPLLVNDVLHAGARYSDEYLSDPEARHYWAKVFADAWGHMQDGFSIIDDTMYNPKGESHLLMPADLLETSLVVHGLHRLAEGNHAEVARVDHVLKNIDAARQV